MLQNDLIVFFLLNNNSLIALRLPMKVKCGPLRVKHQAKAKFAEICNKRNSSWRLCEDFNDRNPEQLKLHFPWGNNSIEYSEIHPKNWAKTFKLVLFMKTVSTEKLLKFHLMVFFISCYIQPTRCTLLLDWPRSGT